MQTGRCSRSPVTTSVRTSTFSPVAWGRKRVKSDDVAGSAISMVLSDTGCRNQLGRSLALRGVPQHDVDDAINNAYFALLRRHKRGEPIIEKCAWVIRVVIYVSRDMAKKYGRDSKRDIEFHEDRSRYVRETDETGGLLTQMQAEDLLSSIGHENRELLELAYLDDFSKEQLAEAFGVSSRTIRRRLQEAQAQAKLARMDLDPELIS